MKNKICIIGVYFGNFPNYINLWLKSCESNPTIDFLIFCDSPIEVCPTNVKMIKTTLLNIKQKASEVVGFDCTLDKPYKLCDFKPIYGLVFRQYLEEYDYWGHCDFDLIFGDLNSFFERYDLYGYDRFNALGHLSLYKNFDEVNLRYMCDGGSSDYTTVFRTDKNCVFDEIPGMTAIYLKKGYPIFTSRVYADIASIYDRYRIIESYKLDEKPTNYPRQIFYWENGKCYRAYFKGNTLYKEEYQYIHFKKRKNFVVDFDVNEVNAFYITKYGFIPKNGEVSLQEIKKYNPYKGKFYEMIEFMRYKANGYFQSLKRIITKRG